MARLIQLTAAHAGPTDAKVWINTDKVVKLEEQKDQGTRIYHEPVVDGFLDYTDVEEKPAEIAKKAHEPIEVSLGDQVVIAISEWPRGRLSINS
jgi:hypothetical protein